MIELYTYHLVNAHFIYANFDLRYLYFYFQKNFIYANFFLFHKGENSVKWIFQCIFPIF